jgi:hypothetical protein
MSNTATAQTLQFQSLLAQIKVDAEWVGADLEGQCQRAIGAAYEGITTEQQAFTVLRLQADERAAIKSDEAKPNTCWQCGCYSPRGECISCKEGHQDRRTQFDHPRKPGPCRANLHPLRRPEELTS